MTLQTSGQISWSDIQAEFASAYDINAYRGLLAYNGANNNVLSSGAISASDFYGLSKTRRFPLVEEATNVGNIPVSTSKQSGEVQAVYGAGYGTTSTYGSGPLWDGAATYNVGWTDSTTGVNRWMGSGFLGTVGTDTAEVMTMGITSNNSSTVLRCVRIVGGNTAYSSIFDDFRVDDTMPKTYNLTLKRGDVVVLTNYTATSTGASNFACNNMTVLLQPDATNRFQYFGYYVCQADENRSFTMTVSNRLSNMSIDLFQQIRGGGW